MIWIISLALVDRSASSLQRIMAQMKTSLYPGDQTLRRKTWRESEHQHKSRPCVEGCCDQASWAAVHTEQLPMLSI